MLLRLFQFAICLLLIAPSAQADTYSRKLFGGWIDLDGDCQNTRQEILIERSFTKVTLNAKGCRVISGLWIDAYTGDIERDASKLDIDHLVPLAEAFRSGADSWSFEQRRAFANDPQNLVITSRNINRAKGDDDPASWLPDIPFTRCRYLTSWLTIKTKWKLNMDEIESQQIAKAQARCP